MSSTIAQVLDLLMILVLIMFIPIGLWRGVLREWLALVGVTFGTLLAAEWATPWGGDLAARTGLDSKMGAFVVGVLLFLGSTLLIGYGGGAALPFRTDLTRANRLLGALLGLGNGTLILSGMLRLMQQHLFDGQSESLLLGTGFSRFLVNDIGWAQLPLLVVLLTCVMVSLLRRWSGGLPLMEEFAPTYTLAPQARGEQDDDTWEANLPVEESAAAAAPGSVAANAGAAMQQQDTAILQIVPAQAGAALAEQPQPRQTPAPAASTRATLVSVPKVIDIARPARATPAPSTPGAGAGGTDPSLSAHARGEQPAGNGPTPLRAESSVNGTAAAGGTTPAPIDFVGAGIACPVCGNVAAARSRFCHHCGHIIGEAERRRVARQE